MRPLPLNRTIILALALAGLLSTACVKSNPPGVGLVKVDTNAVFGIEKKEEAPAGFDAPVDLGDDFSEIPLADLPKLDLSDPPVQTVKDPGPCPTADTRDVSVLPKKSASVTLQGLPPEGAYKWKREANAIVANAALKPPLRVLPLALETRLIRRVLRSSDPALRDHQFSFEMVAPSKGLITNFDITTFIVNNNPSLVVNERVDARTIGVVPVPGHDVRVAAPTDAPGIYISRLETQDSKGTRISSFVPHRPMLIFPLEEGIVRSGQTFSSVGIDPVSTAVLRNEGTVNRTSRVDACGELVEGYSVTIEQTYSSDVNPADPSGTLSKYVAREMTRSVDYTFATQYGALPIAESLTIGDWRTDPVAFTGRWSLGALIPAKLPDTAK